ncbi:MAG: DUF4340 domain-containing protein [Oscillospiraceae bacterium]|nr:DUF4340 domain-containing protein [Oscillospiraceae bacterium]MBQ5336430.1 DUF4340 domain-containing protein [Oscillospiraceae bacterium]
MIKRYMKLLIGLIIAAVIATGAYFGVLVKKNNDAKKAYEEVQKLKIFDFDVSDINGMNIKNSSGEYYFQLTGNGWEITKGDQFRFSADRILNMATAMSKLTATKIVTENGSDNLAAYGLNDPAKLSFKLNGGKEYTAEIGKQVPGDTSWYVKSSGNDTIYIISSDDKDSISPELDDMKDKLLFDAASSEEISHLKYIDHGTVVYDINRNGDEWKLASPFPQGVVNTASVNSITSLLIRAECVTFINEELTDLKKFGFDNPSYQIEVSSSQRSVNVIFGNYYDDAKQYIYAYDREIDQICIYRTAELGFFGTKIEDILFRRLRTENFENISGFDMDILGTEINIEYNYIVAEGKTSSYKVNGKDVNREDESILETFNNLINAITGMNYDEVCEAQLTNLRNMKPEAKITYHLKEDKDYVLEFYKKEDDDKLLYIVENGEYTDTVIKKSSLENGVLLYYKELMEKMK